MPRPKVTVIIPVFNVSQYIERCARSIFEQTLDDLEILFINDCSTDNTVDIIRRTLQDYTHRQETTKILTLDYNSGVAAARAFGMKIAKGEYVIQCDGDDWIDNQLYEKMLNTALSNEADIVISDQIWEYENKFVRNDIVNIPNNGKKFLADFPQHPIGFHFHNKLVRRSIYANNDIYPWKGINMWEDNATLARAFYYAERIVQIHGVAYHYNRTNVNAATAGYGISAVNQMIETASRLADFFYSKEDGEKFTKFVDTLKYHAKLNLITDSFQKYKKYKEIFPESDYIKKELTYKMFSNKGKLRFAMIRFGFAPLFIICFKLKNLLKL